MSEPRAPDSLQPLLAEQIAYYRAIAAEYEGHALHEPGGDELLAAIDSFRPAGQVLELACGPGLGPRICSATPTASPRWTPPQRCSRSRPSG
jgi:hypothetical protein